MTDFGQPLLLAEAGRFFRYLTEDKHLRPKRLRENRPMGRGRLVGKETGIRNGSLRSTSKTLESRREVVIQCAEREKLLFVWTDTSNRLTELHQKRHAAFNRGEVYINRFDTRIRKAKDAELAAEQLYREHLAEHGCG